ncbi:MAG: RES family NAD+ phosphorylase [Bacteroidota bacterium]
MRLFRLAREEYASELLASGASNRWNKAGQYVIYTSGSVSLCALELLAHTNGIRPKGNFKIMHIEVANPGEIYEPDPGVLPEKWYLLSGYPATQQTGSNWYEQGKTLLMKIPSAIISIEWNYVINTRHPDFEAGVHLIEVTDFFWDSRFPEG